MEDARYSRFGRKYQPKMLSDRHHAILRLHLLGYSIREIADKLNCTVATVSNAVNSNLGRLHSQMIKAELDGSAVEAAKRIRELAPKAIQLIEEVMSDSDVPASVRLRAAQDALDRAGFGAVKKMDVRSTSVNLTQDDLEEIKQNAYARARECGLLSNESVEEVEVG